jgi:two-component system phosphate regulon sensor histidine kinase PhoR
MSDYAEGDRELQRELERLRARLTILERVDAERQAIAEQLHEETRVSAAVATENARLLREAQGVRAQHSYLFEGIADAILIADAERRYIDVNPAAEQLLGYSRDELLQLHIDDVVALHPGGSAQERQYSSQSDIWTRELELRHKSGHLIPVESRSSTIELPENVISVSVMRDISDRRQIEKMQREFMTLVTHELKAPLTSLKGFAQLLQRRRAYDAGAIDVILGRTNHLERLINDLLDVQSADSGTLTLRQTHLDLVTIVGRNVEQVRGTTSAHEIQLKTPRQAIVGWWDGGRIGQLLQNLLANAIKYSPYGGMIDIVVSATETNAQVTISDNGIGIPAGALQHVFDRFYRVEAVDHSTVQGLGIGLYIARTLVEAHGGQIGVASTPGQGSTFSVTLPLQV